MRPRLSLAKFALSLRPRRWRSEPKPPRVIKGDVSSSQHVPSSHQQPPTEVTRTPSPAPTEIVEPEPEHILNNLKQLNIKVRDFAYTDAPSSSPVPELFDPYTAIAEYEYRLRATPHVPVPGKTMRRLLVLGWVPPAEADARLRRIDWKAMNDYDARNSGYPYRTLKWSTVPTPHERQRLFENAAPFFRQLDKVRDELRMEEEWLEQERVRGEEAGERAAMRVREVEERERRNMMQARSRDVGGLCVAENNNNGTMAGKKRPREPSPSAPALTNSGSKRLKLSVPGHPPLSPGRQQQYPSAAQDRPPAPGPGQATPPPSDDDSEYPLVGHLHGAKKGSKGLVRTQTFAQL